MASTNFPTAPASRCGTCAHKDVSPQKFPCKDCDQFGGRHSLWAPAAITATQAAAVDDTAGIGDLSSTAKGSGARFNNGKPPYELVPLSLMARIFRAEKGETPEIKALACLGRWQARDTTADWLAEALVALGPQGWAECAQVFDYGRGKYAEWNWAKGMPWSVPLACAARHLESMIHGVDRDGESALPHRGHVFCNVVMLLTYERTYPEGDDRAAEGMLV